MRIERLRDTCTGCGACVSECPMHCIEFSADDEGFYFPSINKDVCIICGRCDYVCHCLNKPTAADKRNTYYGYSKDEDLRKNSTSGGAFAALARNTLLHGGKVYGAAFDYNNFVLRHVSTDKVLLYDLLKGKYIESYMGDTIARVKQDLNKGCHVLLCGTPCQVAGVKRAIFHDDALLTCDFICSGVPSSEIFKSYIESKLHKDEYLADLDFRPKGCGRSKENIKLITSERTIITPYCSDEFYIGAVTAKAFLRRSCYACQYWDKHCSDITIADFTRYRKINPKLNYEKGLSLIIANTDKGRKAAESLSNFELHEIDNKYSDYAFAPKDYSKYYILRNKFYEIYKASGLKAAASKTYMRRYNIQLMKCKIKKLFCKA